MKTVLSKMKYIALALVVVLAFSCSAEDGAPGEQGVQGAQGAQGPQGEKGDKGDPGEDGNGTAGGVVSVLLENQTLVLEGNEFNVPQLTQDIFDNGLVYVYARAEPTEWLPLPVSQLQFGGTEEDPTLASLTVLEMASMEVGKVFLYSLVEGVTDIRFVLVSGTAAEASSFDINDFL